MPNDKNIVFQKLISNIKSSLMIADRLAYSIESCAEAGLVPMSLSGLQSLDDEGMEKIDALLFRYGSLISTVQDALFKSIAQAEDEDLSFMSNRDKTNLMEKIGVLPSSSQFSSLAVIRNKLMHHYPEEAEKHLERINFISEQAKVLVSLTTGIARYCEKFQIDIDFSDYDHLGLHIENESQPRPAQ